MSKQLILEVCEAFNGFYIYHNPSGRCQGMGDGVGVEFWNEEGLAMQAGEKGFVEAWQDEVDENQCEFMMEAYFYDLWALEGFMDLSFDEQQAVAEALEEAT